jgi:hypothetical protein
MTGDFGIAEIHAFLRAIDRCLSTPIRLVIIGGGAAALHHARSTTDDLDTFNQINQTLSDAIDKAREETGYEIPVRCAAVADFPHDYEHRLERHLPDLAHLEVWVVEKHDLVLSKALRCTAHDLQQVHEIHQSVGLDFTTLVSRFRDEFLPYLAATDPRAARDYFLSMIDHLFGEQKKVEAARLVPSAGPSLE